MLVSSAMAAYGVPAVTLTSAGSTFIYPIFAKWKMEYRKLHPDLEVSYDVVGSARGISRTLAGTIDFGASDGPLTDAQLRFARRRLLHVPVVLGAVVAAYNLPGVTQEVRFTPEALAGIFLGTIKQWNDRQIAQANPDVRLPGNPIDVVFRTDGSGTTYVWTDYLSKISVEWHKRVGRGTSVSFPVGIGAQFNEGVMELVKSRPYSFGYLQLTYALQGHVQIGRIENSAGRFVQADTAGIRAAAAAPATIPDDFRASITNASAAEAYPVSSFTWFLVPEKIEDPQKRRALTGFLHWILTDGQAFAAPLHYAPLPGDLAQRVLRVVDSVR